MTRSRRTARAVLLTVVALGIVASTATASSAYTWPTWFSRSEVNGCLSSSNDVLYCGCFIRALRQRLPYNEALRLETALSVGDVPNAKSMSKLRAAAAAC